MGTARDKVSMGGRCAALGLAALVAVLASGCAGFAGGTTRSDAPALNGATATAQGGLPAGAVVLSGTCDAQAAQYAIGRPASEALQAELVTKSLAKTLRLLKPGEAVTQEFSSQRLNLGLDASGRITSARCG